MSTPLFSIVHATARPFGWQSAYAQYRRNAHDWDNCEFILIFDKGQEKEFANVLPRQERPKNFFWYVNDGRPCYIDAANYGCQFASGPILLMSSDDMFCPPQFDVLIKEAIRSKKKLFKFGLNPPDRYEDIAVWCSCGYRPDIMCMQVLSKSYFNRYGFVFDPVFESMNGDIDYTYRAQRDGVIIDARDICFEHQHYHVGKRSMDASDKVNASDERQAQGDREIEKRWGPQWATALDKLYGESIATPSDIFEHLPVLKELAKGKEVLELGVRYGNSTRAFLAGRPKRLLSVDKDWSKAQEDTLIPAVNDQGIHWGRAHTDSRHNKPPCDQECDITFVDTLHTAAQVRAEIAAHEPYTRERLIFHDTVTNGDIGEDGGPGIMVPIREMLARGEWVIERHYQHCNGLLILKRKPIPAVSLLDRSTLDRSLAPNLAGVFL